MPPPLSDLIGDSLFQLNAIIWLCQPLPRGLDIRPVFFEQGFSLHSLNRRLSLAPNVRAVLHEAEIAANDSTRPDAIIARRQAGQFGMIECKRSAFTVASDNCEQARTALLCARTLAGDILGTAVAAGQNSHALFMLPESECDAMANTVEHLATELEACELWIGTPAVLGFYAEPNGFGLNVGEAAGEFFDLEPGRIPVLSDSDGIDVRPFYFIPYDANSHSSKAEADHCKELLLERVRQQFVSIAGKLRPPKKQPVAADDVLDAAMFGMFALYQDRDVARHLRSVFEQFAKALRASIDAECPKAFDYEPNRKQWIFNVSTAEARTAILKILRSFSCKTLTVPIQVQQSLFPEGTG